AGRGQEGFVRLPAEIRIKAFGRFAQKRGVEPVSECLLFSTVAKIEYLTACTPYYIMDAKEVHPSHGYLKRHCR
ncbi:MAG: hypothetical protein FWG30_04100, partial [Eubacteriaceae bacterium]|nr:hypothetical protein [Eubacteriaceae bacterium]